MYNQLAEHKICTQYVLKHTFVIMLIKQNNRFYDMLFDIYYEINLLCYTYGYII